MDLLNWADAEFALRFLLGLVFLLAAFIQHGKNARMKKNGVLAEGVVFRLQHQGSNYFPVVRFLTQQQEWITSQCEEGTSPPSFKEGENVKIRYNPNAPHEFEILSAGAGMGVWVAALIGLGLVGYSLWAYLES